MVIGLRAGAGANDERPTTNDPTNLPPLSPLRRILTVSSDRRSRDPRAAGPASRDRGYPTAWERVAELRVFRTPLSAWERLIAWRADMRRHGWRLLRVTSDARELVAVFGKTKPELTGRDD